MRPLHITNGDSTAELIKKADINGDILPWRDPMHHGPFTAHAGLSQASEQRAPYLAGDLFDPATVLEQFIQRDTTLKQRSSTTEAVLWFEHDLLDQLQILQILHELPHPQNTTIICIDRFDGISPFRGLGQLTPEQIASLYAGRTAITESHCALASQLWAQFCSDTPQALLAFSKTGSPLFPYMQSALLRHCQEFPWCIDGLTRTERQLLTLINNGTDTPSALFIENMNLEDALFIGDWRTFSVIEALATSRCPLITPVAGRFISWSPDNQAPSAYHQQQLTLTESGCKVLAQTLHAGDLIKRDQWLGGVHIQSSTRHWQWNDADQAFELAERQ